MDSSVKLESIEQQETSFFPPVNHQRLAIQDFVQSILQWRVWFLLAYQDIQLRYRRSILGPFWITLSMAITVYSMGFLYAHLFHVDLEQYYPFLVSGMLAWSLISGVITELTDTFIHSGALIKQIKLPYTLYVNRVATRNLIIFFHNIVVIFPILLIFHEYASINFYTLMLIPALVILYINMISYGLILGMLGARYRDVSQIIKSLIQVVFFVTPVMWNADVLPARFHSLMYLNPFYIFVELVRLPLMGHEFPLHVLEMAGLFTLVGIATCAFMFKKYRSRIIYWL